MSIENVTGVTVVYETLELAKLCILSFRNFYPTVKLIVIDNSKIGSPCSEFLKEYEVGDKYISVYHTKRNLGHGLGMDVGIRMCETDYVYVCDSDTEIIKPGLIESMLSLMKENVYGIGPIDYIAYSTGAWCSKDSKESMRRVWVYSSLISKKRYLEFPRFDSDAGTNAAPLKNAMRGIHDTGKSEEMLLDFDVTKYVIHHYGGTRKKYGIPKLEGAENV